MLKKDINKKIYYALIFILVVVKLLLVSQQMMYIMPKFAPIDDDLYFALANNITNGNWLGEYNSLTLAKFPFFAIYLSFVHMTGIPYLIANQLMFVLLSFVAVYTVAPITKTNNVKLLIFFVFLYNPATFASYTLRVYRDSVYPVFCMMFFFGIIGVAIRLKKSFWKMLPFNIIAGIGLSLSWITREDGYWLLPFGVVAFIVTSFYIVKGSSKIKAFKISGMILPYIMTACTVLTICSINNKYYGEFILTDFSSGEFAKAYGQLTRFEHKNWNPVVAVPSDVREIAYENSNNFKKLEDLLKSDPVRYGYIDSKVGDFKSGSFYWAVRKVAQEEGIYQDLQTSNAFWDSVYNDLKPVADNTEGSLKNRASVTPPIKLEYVPMVVGQAFDTFVHIMLYKDLDVYQENLSDSSMGLIGVWEKYLNQKSNYSAIENTAIPYHTNLQNIAYKILGLFKIPFMIFNAVGLVCYVIGLLHSFKNFKKLNDTQQLLEIGMFGVLMMSIFRIFIISYMEVSAFQIGISSMYVSGVYPMLLLVAIYGILKKIKI